MAQGRAARRALGVSARNGDVAWIEKGLAEGERVVVYPADALREGSRVREVRTAR